MLIYNWLRISVALPEDAKVHFLQFSAECRGRDRKGGSWFIWLATLWLIWNIRNSVVFREGEPELSKIVDLIQFKSWLWLKAKVKGFTFSMFEWASNPLACLESL